MKDKGVAHIGIGEAKGDDKALEAVQEAVSSPLLETTIEGASHVIINISGDISLMDANDAASYVQELTGEDTNIIFGAMYDDSVADTARITVIATGLDEATTRQPSVERAIKAEEEKKQNAFGRAGYRMPEFKLPKANTNAPTAPRTPVKDIQIPDFLR